MNPHMNNLDWINILMGAISIASFGIGLATMGDALLPTILGTGLVVAGIVGFLITMLCTALGLAVRVLANSHGPVVLNNAVPASPSPMPTAADYEWTRDGYRLKKG